MSVINPKIIKIPNTNKSINLEIRHLQDPKKIQEDIINPIHLYDLVHIPMHNYVLTTISVILLCCLAFIIYHWQKQRRKKAIPLKILQRLVNDDVKRTEDG